MGLTIACTGTIESRPVFARKQRPLLWLSGEIDQAITAKSIQSSADLYGADYVMMEKAGHNLMMEHNYRQAVEIIHNWLVEQEID